MHKYFKKIGNTEISHSRSLRDYLMKSLNLHLHHSPKLKYTGKRMYVKLNGNYLKQDKIIFNHEKQQTFTLFMI